MQYGLVQELRVPVSNKKEVTVPTTTQKTVK
jgi:hypothetical protein